MTAEPLCSNGQQQERQQKQTIDQSTKSGSPKEGQEDGSGKSNRSRRNESSSISSRLLYDIDTARSDSASSSGSSISNSDEDNTNCHCIDKFEQNCNNSTTKRVAARRLIDSRSILTNKEKLKRFWERKMELEFKLRHQDLKGAESLRNSICSSGQQQRQVSSAQKLVTFDENNNSSSEGAAATSGRSDGVVSADLQHKLKQGEEEISGSSDKQHQHQHTIQFSDEEWQSLSPNVKPTSDAFSAARPGSRQSRHYEKLHESEATCAPIQQVASGKQAKSDADKKQALEQVGRGDKLVEREQVALASERSVAKSQSSCDMMDIAWNSPAGNDIATDEIQLLSIDPTLCHSEEDSADNEKRFAAPGREGLARKNWSLSQEDLEAGQSHASGEREEQSANEEFSSSNSSFGPMSISISVKSPDQSSVGTGTSDNRRKEAAPDQRLQQAPEAKSRKQQQQQQQTKGVINSEQDDQRDFQEEEEADDDDDDDDDDERNLTLSGSVLTVITATHDDPTKSQTSSFDHVSLENEASDLVPAMALESTGDQRLNTVGYQEGSEDDEEPKSNIGVAFESLQFDTEIKSSVQEVVEEEPMRFLGAPAPPVFKRSLMAKFDSSVVKSVCSFINAAISDATKQVENTSSVSPSFSSSSTQLRSSSPTRTETDDDLCASEVNNNSTGHEGDDEADLSEYKASRGSIQHRATFVQESSSSYANMMLDPANEKKTAVKRSNFEEEEEDDDDDEDDDDEEKLHSDGEEISADLLSNNNFKADLSSIFEANVRREIERFETNSTDSKSKSSSGSSTSGGGRGGKAINKNGLTEWRIAEEIRLFNEREMELKNRFQVAKNGEPEDTEFAQLSLSSSTASFNAPHQSDFTSSSQLVAALSTKFNATKSAIERQQTDEVANQLQQVHNRSIKLSTSVATDNKNIAQPTTTISMHKFISSGGKRFVFTSSSNSNNNLSTTASNNFQNKQLTKSMSNLSISSTTSTAKSDKQQQQQQQQQQQVALAAPPAKVVDYKAVDSLKCKETPNVKPGLTRKAIETFSRLNQHSSSSELNNNNGLQPHPAHQKQQYLHNNNRIVSEHRKQLSAMQSPAIMSAEWKIQEELREMRAREAELRNQQRYNNQQTLSSGASRQVDAGGDSSTTLIAPKNGSQSSHEQPSAQVAASCIPSKVDQIKDSGGRKKGIGSKSIEKKNENIRALERPPASSQVSLQSQKPSVDRLSFSNETLYPIKQTIESFKKFSSQANNNNINSMVPSQHVSVNKIQRKLLLGISNNSSAEQQITNEQDYESKVGGQRRKINMIEKWENGILKPL